MKLYDLTKYVIKDKYQHWKEGSPLRLYEVYMYVGEVGQGKTLSAVNEALKLKEKDARINIYTNFHMKGQDGEINHWSDMLEVPSYSIIILDEIQNTFDQRSWNTFPPQITQLLTQNRKWGKDDGTNRPPGVRLMFTTQDYENTDIMIRRLCNKVITCRAFLNGRAIFNKHYRRKEFEKSEGKRVKCGMNWFVGTDGLRNSYDTYKVLETMKEDASREKQLLKEVNL